MRTLHLLASADRRGAEVFGVSLADRLGELGHDADVVALHPPASPGAGLDVDIVAGFPRPAAIHALRQRARACDAVLGHGSRGLVAGTAATVATSTPLVYRSIGDPTFWGASRARQLRVGLQLRRAAAVTALWPAAGDAIVAQYRVDPDRIHIIPNGADERRFQPADDDQRAQARAALDIDDDRPVVAYLGALSPEKRVPVVVQSTALVPDAVLVVAGDGPVRPEVQAALEAAVPRRHRMLGSVPDVLPILHAADAVVLLSSTEGQPGVAIEAGLCGVPVLATDVGGVGSVVTDGVTGRLVAADAPPSDVADTLQQVLAERAALGAAAAERCRTDFSLEVVTRQFDDLLRAVAPQR